MSWATSPVPGSATPTSRAKARVTARSFSASVRKLRSTAWKPSLRRVSSGALWSARKACIGSVRFPFERVTSSSFSWERPGGGAAPERAGVHDLLRGGQEGGTAALQVRGVSADDVGEPAGGGVGGSAGDARVDEPDAALRGKGADLAHRA